MGDLLYDRRAILTVGTMRVRSQDSLRFRFTVDKNLKPEPNKAEIVIFNLNSFHQTQIDLLGTVPVQLEAGYSNATSVIFLGDLRTGFTTSEGPDDLTVIGSGDGEQAVRKSRVNISIAKGTNTDQVLKQIALALGVKPGNLDDAARKIRSAFSGTGNLFTMGTVLSGSAYREMCAICKSLNLEWSIQDGKLQILERGKALSTEAIVLNKDTGLYGEPTIDNKGIMSCTMAMQKDVFPGRIVLLQAERIKGQFRLEETSHKGDTREAGAGSWVIEAKGKRY